MLKKVGGGLQFIVFFFFFTIYSTPPSILSLTSTQAGLRPNLHSGWPSGPRPLASSELSYKALYYSTIYQNSGSPFSLAWVQHTQAGLWPNPHIGWPLGLRSSAKPNPTVCRLACRWWLRLALWADQESFSIDSGPHPCW